MKNLFLLFTLSFCSVAFAEATNLMSSNTEEIRSSSTRNRLNKNWMTTGSIMAMGPAGTAGVGVNIGFFLTENSLLQIEISGGETNENDDDFIFDTWKEKTVKKGYAAGLHYKYFTGNSFYIKAGANYRSFSFSETDTYTPWMIFGSPQEPIVASRSFKGESVAAALGLGNQWQFENFTLGCNWFEVSLPISSRIYDEELSANSTETDRKRNRDDKRLYVTGVGFTALNFYLGASF